MKIANWRIIKMYIRMKAYKEQARLHYEVFIHCKIWIIWTLIGPFFRKEYLFGWIGLILGHEGAMCGCYIFALLVFHYWVAFSSLLVVFGVCNKSQQIFLIKEKKKSQQVISILSNYKLFSLNYKYCFICVDFEYLDFLSLIFQQILNLILMLVYYWIFQKQFIY